MSGTVNYPKVVDHLTDVIKELNVPCAEPHAPATAAERHADAVDLLRGLLNKLESHDADAHAAAAEHSATADESKQKSGQPLMEDTYNTYGRRANAGSPRSSWRTTSSSASAGSRSLGPEICVTTATPGPKTAPSRGPDPGPQTALSPPVRTSRRWTENPIIGHILAVSEFE